MPENNKNIPTIISKANKNNQLHVFLINGPISLVVSRMIIDDYGIKKNNLFISCMRNTDTSLIYPAEFLPNEYWYDRYFEKIFGIRLKALRILKKILEKNKNFILYCSWAELGTEKIIESKNCIGHIYIEEGQLSYAKIEPFNYKSSPIFKTITKNIYHLALRKLTSNSSYATDYSKRVKYHFRDDAEAFIGITPGVFPLIPKEKRYFLDNYKILKKYYKPKLLGIKTIGLTCAERRLKRSQWSLMLKKLVKRMPQGGIIKLHPSFIVDPKKVEIIKSLLKEIGPDNIMICDDDVIIEIEMLYEPKVLIGSLTSLSVYANVFGSKFEDVELY